MNETNRVIQLMKEDDETLHAVANLAKIDFDKDNFNKVEVVEKIVQHEVAKAEKEKAEAKKEEKEAWYKKLDFANAKAFVKKASDNKGKLALPLGLNFLGVLLVIIAVISRMEMIWTLAVVSLVVVGGYDLFFKTGISNKYRYSLLNFVAAYVMYKGQFEPWTTLIIVVMILIADAIVEISSLEIEEEVQS